jgi:hypothetical protein
MWSEDRLLCSELFYHHAMSCINRNVLDISSVFPMKNMQDAGIDNVFSWRNPIQMYTIFSAVLRQQRKSDVMTSFSHSDRSAVYYEAGSH